MWDFCSEGDGKVMLFYNITWLLSIFVSALSFLYGDEAGKKEGRGGIPRYGAE